MTISNVSSALLAAYFDESMMQRRKFGMHDLIIIRAIWQLKLD
jgi:hypothetical protein